MSNGHVTGLAFVRQFIEETNGHASSKNLCMIFGVFIGGIVVLYLTFYKTLDWSIFGAFLAATGGVYSVGKWRDSTVAMEQIKADSPYPPATLAPATVIQNMPSSSSDMDVPAKNVTVKAKGNVSVSKDRSKR